MVNLLLSFLMILYANVTMTNTVAAIQAQTKDEHIFDKEKLNDFKRNPDYDYDENIKESGLWADIKEWLFSVLKKLFNIDDTSGFWERFFDLLPYLSILLFFGIFVWYLIRYNTGSQIMRQHDQTKVTLTEEEELLMKRNLQALAEKAIKNEEYRMAVRYLYLDCIKRLDMKRMIRFTNDKTNYDYIKEIKYKEVSNQFKSLTISYEQVWYGHITFNQVYFTKLYEYFKEFHLNLDQKEYAKG